ncbi:23S rRNA pseudouridine(2604) synthase RluF [Paenibacillus taichungensis]|uniref:Pseudouridine synthase n=1 Tax=Paenibacillus taichungensis TaxID=484184 RepID=A0ABX2MMB0_9BACL|nr:MULTISPECIES: 23S rRNA pseudouridine(2604) synthase RluF [Paenibacillus]MDR9749701.1 23S rRNA pseudouridine(2604) synthase RluF [Paenibacillus taichungensis]MEC0111463.1 23S rRNA pseudouridine(2604) synthase RluF [Paenibacillus taichungensis]MEC0200829.1 23S rRNA pseudouridine(2604) synthase RluF [Paenibacillus taichungensis]NUU55189.1 23S rRNA pseudouridine(2604) synthase RluF [Paenibacillus taichungensis]PIH55473.1 23S rRNA pseudouridine(2604) synthase RluF [Paenibacillus sp. LK1]
MRINKFISETGFCSRREADRLVESGKVTINGVKAELGSQAEDGDDVRINGQPIKEKRKHVYIALNKPVGITSTTEQHIQGNIVDFVGHKERIFPIGRLDKDSEGLILMTNDGDIVNRILRAEGRHEKEYIVTVDRAVTPSFLRGMSTGVKILGEMTLPCTVTRISERVFRIILTEGKNRQIRRMCSAFGYEVRKLKRIRIMNIHLGEQATGTWRELTPAEKSELSSLLDYNME